MTSFWVFAHLKVGWSNFFSAFFFLSHLFRLKSFYYWTKIGSILVELFVEHIICSQNSKAQLFLFRTITDKCKFEDLTNYGLYWVLFVLTWAYIFLNIFWTHVWTIFCTVFPNNDPILVNFKTFWKKPIICSTGLETGCKPVLLMAVYFFKGQN